MKSFILIFTFLLAVGNISIAQDMVNTKNTATERAPKSITVTENNNNNQISAFGGRWFGQNAAATSFFARGVLNTTGSLSNFGPGSTSLFGGMEFSNTGTLYCIAVAAASPLQTLDTVTGALTTLGAITGIGSEQVLSLSFNNANNTMYLTTTVTGGDKLYTLDLTTRVATLVGNAGQNFFGIAINSTGLCYAISIDDNLYSINLTSAAGTLIGPIGFDANFIQGLSFDRQTDTLWYAAYNNTALRGELRTVNLTSGATNLIAPFNPAAEVCGFAIPSSAPPPPVGGSITITRNQYVQIPDNGGNANPAVDNIDISGIAGNVEIKKVTLTINNVVQSWVGDLRFWLTKGNSVDTSISRIGWTGTGFGNSCDNLTGTVLSDSAGLTNIQNIPTVCVGGLAQATGNFNPKEPFSQFQNSGVNPNGTYTLRISDNAAGDTGSLRSWTLKIDYDIITGVNNNVTSIANDYSLSQNYPNPFNPSTKIAYSIPTNGLVTLKIYNILGKEVQTLVSEVKSAGSYEVSFNAASLSSGVYFYKLESGDFIDTKKMFLLK
ncbi:MAG TPA: T9SS type A sorting domain-containing protein [Ignavibacteria bacterium]|nr:T9SS type A sorting domain-containing protein [Ignavibacteria bacterium]